MEGSLHYPIDGFVQGNDFVAIDEINCLANNGYQEIVLTGIHTGSYGDGEDFDIVDLIREVSKNDNLFTVPEITSPTL